MKNLIVPLSCFSNQKTRTIVFNVINHKLIFTKLRLHNGLNLINRLAGITDLHSTQAHKPAHEIALRNKTCKPSENMSLVQKRREENDFSSNFLVLNCRRTLANKVFHEVSVYNRIDILGIIERHTYMYPIKSPYNQHPEYN